MNRQQMTAAFAEEELHTFKGRGGKTFTFIEDETVMDRLDAGYGYGNWQVQVEPVVSAPGVVRVRLGVRENGEWLWFEDFGYPNQQDGDVLKEAVSDGIRRCGRYVGIARDLYRKSTYEPGGALAPKPSERNPRVGASDYEPPIRPEDNSLIGTVELGKPSAKTDLELRETPDGHVIGFRLVSPKGGIKVLAFDPLASALALVKSDLPGQRVTCWGRLSEEKFTPAGSKREVRYLVMVLEKIATPDFVLPAPRDESELPDPPIEDDPELDLALDLA